MNAFRTDISVEVRALCKALGVSPWNVYRIEIGASGHAVIDMFKENEDGKKCVDEVTGKAAMERLTFEVIT